MSTIEQDVELILQDGVIDPETGLRFIEYPKEGDEVPLTAKQYKLMVYLTVLLSWLLPKSEYTVLGDMVIYRTEDDEAPLSPDVSIFPVASSEENQPGRWLLEEPNRPVPTVVFEICSRSTWRTDIRLEKKPTDYQNLGVKEYFAYDPHTPQVWNVEGTRLLGWRYINKVRQPIEPNDKGWLWSEELNSWLVPDEAYLRLYDRDEHIRLTEAEAKAEALRAEKEARKAEGIKRKAEEDARKAAENALKAEESKRKAAENAQKAAEKQLADLKALLKAQGIKLPDEK